MTDTDQYETLVAQIMAGPHSLIWTTPRGPRRTTLTESQVRDIVEHGKGEILLRRLREDSERTDVPDMRD